MSARETAEFEGNILMYGTSQKAGTRFDLKRLPFRFGDD